MRLKCFRLRENKKHRLFESMINGIKLIHILSILLFCAKIISVELIYGSPITLVDLNPIEIVINNN